MSFSFKWLKANYVGPRTQLNDMVRLSADFTDMVIIVVRYTYCKNGITYGRDVFFLVQRQLT
jgi:hypothetical protein